MDAPSDYSMEPPSQFAGARGNTNFRADQSSSAEIGSYHRLQQLDKILGPGGPKLMTQTMLLITRSDNGLLLLRQQLLGLFFWEGVVSLGVFFAWCGGAHSLARIWLHFPHFFRWWFGRSYVLKNVPVGAEVLVPEDSVGFDTLFESITRSAEGQAHQAGRTSLTGSLLAAFTFGSIILDFIGFMITVTLLNESKYGTFLAVVAFVYQAFNIQLFRILYDCQVYMPTEYKKHISPTCLFPWLSIMSETKPSYQEHTEETSSTGSSAGIQRL
uniref:Uncharacterized protein n=1 Tax=Fibrocapsa japonica TaxID=94617 RepID=A0A7S2UTC7_9STRA|mmetsp:Transcript_12466/g.18384  ORF Transcript_12466/g.18384 Transcript_12466/m.18384 type:complete len:271 (+) Transcript_12466:155-967(+)